MNGMAMLRIKNCRSILQARSFSTGSKIYSEHTSGTGSSKWSPPEDNSQSNLLRWSGIIITGLIAYTGYSLLAEFNRFSIEEGDDHRPAINKYGLDGLLGRKTIQNDHWLEDKAKEAELLRQARAEGQIIKQELKLLKGSPQDRTYDKEFLYPGQQLFHYSPVNHPVGWEFDTENIKFRQSTAQKVSDSARKYKELHNIED